MSLINRMLRDLDKRHAAAAPPIPPAATTGVRPVSAGTVGSEGFWRLLAGIMVVALIWVGWLIWQLTPHPVVTDLALQAVGKSRAVPPVASSSPAPQAIPAETTPQPAQAVPTADRVQFELLQFATELSSPRPRPTPRPRPAAAEPALTVVPGTAARAPAPAATPAEAPVPRAHAASTAPAASAAVKSAQIDKRMSGTADDLAEREYRRGVGLANQGRMAEALDALQTALRANPEHEAARQTLASFLIESRRFDDAERVLRAGLDLKSGQLSLAIPLARLLVERGDVSGASGVLDRHGSQSLDPQLQAFRGALHQRLGRHREAVEDYQAALRSGASNSAWWVGLGISLQAIDRRAEALDAFRRARAAGAMSQELSTFVDQRIRSLN